MHRRTQSGFTLIETVISLVLLSFIALIGYQGLIFGMEQWRKGHDRLESRYAYQQAMGWVRNTVGTQERVVDRRISLRSLVFDGKPGSVEFVARFERARRGGLYVTRLFHDPQDSRLKVSYYLHHPEIDPRARWHDAWSDAATLPRLIRIEIETVDGVNYQSIVSVLTSNDV